MVRILSALVFGLALIGFAGFSATAEEPKKKESKEAKEMTLEGKITCPKCDLGEAEKCATVIKVKDKLYWFDAASNKKYHSDICKAAIEGKVTGKVTKDGDKMMISVTKLEYKK